MRNEELSESDFRSDINRHDSLGFHEIKPLFVVKN